MVTILMIIYKKCFLEGSEDLSNDTENSSLR